MIRGNKIGAAIICYDTCEYLNIIYHQLEGLCDEIVLFVPKNTYCGKEVDENVLKYAYSASNKGYDIQSKVVQTGENEDGIREADRQVRNYLSKYLFDKGCKYGVVFDCDEIVTRDEFERMAEFAINHNAKVTYVKVKEYYKDTMYAILNNPKYIPFICKLPFSFRSDCEAPLTTDSNKIVNTKAIGGLPYMVINGIIHKLSWVRKNITSRIDSGIDTCYLDDEARGFIKSRYNKLNIDVKHRILYADTIENGIMIMSTCLKSLKPFQVWSLDCSPLPQRNNISDVWESAYL